MLQPLETPIVKETRPPVKKVLPSMKPHVLNVTFGQRVESHLKRPAQEVIEKMIMKIVKLEESPHEEIQSENEDQGKYAFYAQKVETRFTHQSEFVSGENQTFCELPSYPKWKQNKTSHKSCLFDGCQHTTKRLRDHVERSHLPACLSRECFNAEKTKVFLKSFCRSLGVNGWSVFAHVIENRIYSVASTVITQHDQEMCRRFYYSIREHPLQGRLTLSPPNSVASLCHWRLMACIMNYLDIPDAACISGEVTLGALATGNIIDSHCHVVE